MTPILLLVAPRRRLVPALLVVFAGFLAAVQPLGASLSDQVASANAALAAGRPIEALESYRAILSSPSLICSGSTELWYNRGLAEEKNGDAAAASLSFRRALLLDPGFAPARVQLATVLGILGLPESAGWREQVTAILHPETLVLGGAIAGWIGVLLLVVLLFKRPRRKGFIAASLLLAVAGHGCSVFGTLADPRTSADGKGVVISKSATELRATPADSAASLTSVPPGTSVRILSRNGAWWYVSPAPGLTGWIPSTTVSPLLPFLSSAGS